MIFVKTIQTITSLVPNCCSSFTHSHFCFCDLKCLDLVFDALQHFVFRFWVLVSRWEPSWFKFKFNLKGSNHYDKGSEVVCWVRDYDLVWRRWELMGWGSFLAGCWWWGFGRELSFGSSGVLFWSSSSFSKSWFDLAIKISPDLDLILSWFDLNYFASLLIIFPTITFLFDNNLPTPTS